MDIILRLPSPSIDLESCSSAKTRRTAKPTKSFSSQLKTTCDTNHRQGKLIPTQSDPRTYYIPSHPDRLSSEPIYTRITRTYTKSPSPTLSMSQKKQSVNQSVNQSISQSVNQSISQSINQSISTIIRPNISLSLPSPSSFSPSYHSQTSLQREHSQILSNQALTRKRGVFYRKTKQLERQIGKEHKRSGEGGKRDERGMGRNTDRWTSPTI